ncbi:T9SS type A sorting domain-containing protein [Carboxylicivirga linearis]|uniref:T9SS type A sorting domain-containing protein n=1 Tax=Carboxylicivirga linearis TaxID=1628157 RepID=A0ABS5JQR4_9BACT|nr:T9SS type A sorting domain-containing protein [Carboxylicivirga linearis]MBS2097228.1 T9SS type A sorting domain-containing protein [Carboxylicivirga linearis]
MNKLFTLLALFGMLSIAYSENNTTAAYDGGDGTENDPFQIASLDQLRTLSETVADWDKHFILTSNIDASASSTWNSSNGFSPIGNKTNNFTGSLNGRNHTISGLTCNVQYTDYRALFGYIINASIINVGMKDCNVKGKEYTATLVGYANQSIISNCHATGGLVQGANGNTVAGLIGMATTYSEVTYCYTNLEIQTGYGYTGGLMGSLVGSSSMRYCFSFNSINSTGGYGAKSFGGLVAQNQTSTIEDCYSHASVHGYQWVAAFAGRNYSNETTFASISNCYATGNVSGTYTTAGFIGSNEGASTATNCYFDTETTGQTNAIAIDENSQTASGYETSMFSDADNFPGWDFDEIWVIKTVTEYDANPRPYLQWQFGYNLNFVADGNGSINGETIQIVQRADNASTVEAIPDASSEFIEWQAEDGTSYSTENPLTIQNVTSNLNLTAVFSITTNIETSSGTGTLIYPNPTKGDLFIKAEGIKNVELMNLNGSVINIFNISENQDHINLSDYGKGLYIVRVTTTKGSFSKKIIVE